MLPNGVTVTWNIEALIARKGWENANRLALGAGLTYPVAERVWKNAPMDRIDLGTLEKLRVAFGIRGAPWALLTYHIPPKRRP